ncbi:hypothetical protein [Pseudobutyrivibrio sp.]|uniref:hypothetical protein n=1 Tax=Pseudobutyrivibrio sp. TaxID=2014367 RepID=UPI00386F6090
MENIIQEGKRGLLRALTTPNDRTSEISTEHAEKGKVYYCPYCGIEMHLMHPHNSIPIFAKNPGKKHKNSVCKEIDEKGVYHSFAASKSPEELISSFCHTSSKRTGIPKGTDETPPIGKADNKNKPLDDSMKEKQFSSLAQIAKYDLEDFSPTETFGDYQMKDYVLYYRWFKYFFDSQHNPIPINARIVAARYYLCDKKENLLFFEAFSKNLETNSFETILFIVRVNPKSTFQKLLEKFMGYTMSDDGRSSYRKLHKFQDVFLASDSWELLSKSEFDTQTRNIKEYLKKEYIGVYIMDLTNTKQIYLFDPED